MHKFLTTNNDLHNDWKTQENEKKSWQNALILGKKNSSDVYQILEKQHE